MFNKQHVAALGAEFFGTAILALTILSVVNSQLGVGFFIALAAGIVLMMLVAAFGGVSGAHFNPAVTVGLFTIRKTSAARAVTYILVQLLGAYVAFALFNYYRGQDAWGWDNHPGVFSSRMFVAEVVGTAIFCFGIAAAVLNKMETGAKAATIGGALAVAILITAGISPAFLNPAIAFASQTVHWVNYVLGPVLGAVIGFNIYALMYAASNAPARVKAKNIAPAPEVVAEEKAAVEAVKLPKAPVKPAKTTTKPAAKTAKKPAKAAAKKK